MSGGDGGSVGFDGDGGSVGFDGDGMSVRSGRV